MTDGPYLKENRFLKTLSCQLFELFNPLLLVQLIIQLMFLSPLKAMLHYATHNSKEKESLPQSQYGRRY